MFAINHIAAALLSAAFAAGTVAAQDHPKPTPAAPAPKAAEKQDPAKTPPVYVIAKVGTKTEIIAKSEVDGMKKKLDDQAKMERESYEKAKKAAEEKKEKFDKAAPVPTAFVVEKGEFPSREAAEAAIKKMEADKATEKGKEKPKADEKPKEKPKDPK